MEFLIFAIVAFIVFIAAVISGMKEAEKKQAVEKALRKEERKKKQNEENAAKFPKIEYSLQDTCIYCDVVGTSYRDSVAIERARNLQNYEPVVLEWEPENVKDIHAVKVLTQDAYHIGYIPANVAIEIYDKLENVLHSVVNGNSYGYDAPYISIAIILKGNDNLLYFDNIINNIATRIELKKRIPELEELNGLLFDELLNKIDELIKKYPNEFLLEYKYLLALRISRKHNETIEYISMLKEKYPPLARHKDIQEIYQSALDCIKTQEELARQEKARKLHYQAKEMFDSGNYAEALPPFLESIELNSGYQQALRFVCICYEKLGQVENIKPFCIKMKKKEWVTNHSKMQMDKYIKKYS